MAVEVGALAGGPADRRRHRLPNAIGPRHRAGNLTDTPDNRGGSDGDRDSGGPSLFHHQPEDRRADQ